MKKTAVGDFLIGKDEPLTIICGPCVIEDREHSLTSAKQLKEIFDLFPFNFIFKSSFDKANRSSVNSFRGPGLDEGLRILEEVKKEFNIPVTTDIHLPNQAKSIAEVCEMIQIPAFLCRQTDLLIAAGKTNAAINVKKGQFMAPWDMKNVIEKLLSTNNDNIILTERGSSFGYNNLVCDMRTIPIMQSFGFPVCFDATHSVQLPGAQGASSGGQREFIPNLAKAAIAAGCDCLFFEAHPNPTEAKSDSSCVIDIKELPKLLKEILILHQAITFS